jgi:UTP--glucose-1-phosphate uridylyltransferase
LLGDDIIDSDPPCLKQMMDLYDDAQTSVIATQTVPWEDVNKYGIISPSALKGAFQYIDDLIEKPERDQAPSNMAVIGRYVIEPEIFAILEHCQPGRGGEIQLTDALRILNQQKPMIAYIQQGKRYDVGDKLGYIEATIEFALQRKELQPQLLAYLKDLMKQWP